MTAIDPYRTLELAPGASQPEIKRAYRRLAKLYHPDSAGERALSRFLAIQAAYEILVVEPGRPRASGRGTANRPPPAPAPAWQADADRARATREAYRARTRKTAGASPRASASAGGSAGPTPDPTTGRAGGSPTGGSSTGQGASAGASGGGSGRAKRSNRRTKATIGSTSYDGADREPFDPAWEGATWYGAGSGTYWTINPKEYADPRKHGPDYLARSRRVAGGATGTTPPARASTGAAPAWASSGPTPPPPAEPLVAPDHPLDAQARPGRSTWSWLTSTLPGRVLVALVGWIPIGVALAALTEAVPVCSGIGTVCRDPLTGGLWLVDLAVIVVLLAVPRLGWIAAIGSAAFFVVGILATPILLAIGGSRTPSGSASVLGIVLTVAWFGGIAVAVSGRVDLPPWRRRVR